MSKTNQPNNYATCGAKTRAGTPCKRPAGWGTDHVGEGKCKLHGGKSKGAPKKNKNSEKHGLFSKYLPEETKELIKDISEISPIDIMWGNIEIAYAAIIWAQKLMHVESKEELIKYLKKEKESEGEYSSSWEKEYEIQFAWDRHERFLNSQARAMTTLTNMIMKYDELCKSDMATEEQKLRNEELKVKIEKLKGIDLNSDNKVVIIDDLD